MSLCDETQGAYHYNATIGGLMPGVRREQGRRFEERATEIIHKWTDLRSSLAGSESPNAWFKRNAYGFLRPYVDEGDFDLFQRQVKRDRRPTKLVQDALSNPFKLGLLAMFADDSLSRSNRHVFGNQMLYAYLHDVPPEFLNGFLAVSGGPSVIASKLKEGTIEPGFENRPRRTIPQISE